MSLKAIGGGLTLARFTRPAQRTVFIAVAYGRHCGLILLDHLFLALALQDVGLVEGIQLPMPEGPISSPGALPRDRCLVSEAFFRAVFEFAASEIGRVDNRTLAAALRRCAATLDRSANSRGIDLREIEFQEADRKLLRDWKMI